jgi:hypothetical protein
MMHKIDQDLKISKEDRLLILCARTRMNDEIQDEIRSIVQQEIDWDYILHRSLEHRLIPLLYWQLNVLGSDFVPPDFMEIIKTLFHENAQLNLLFLGELLKILEVLRSHNIMAVP